MLRRDTHAATRAGTNELEDEKKKVQKYFQTGTAERTKQPEGKYSDAVQTTTEQRTLNTEHTKNRKND